MGVNLSDTYVLLKPRNEWTTADSREELVEKMEADSRSFRRRRTPSLSRLSFE